jgi:3-deoxy-manno-octulosonate cytidylyltransferase (CMP-KDO synthetase)
LNVQGDEPLMPLSTVRGLLRFALQHPGVQVVTARVPIRRGREIADPNVVKVVVDREGRALYFSRCAIPYRREARPEAEGVLPARYFKHVGVYLYRREVLLDFSRRAAAPLESAECLEQLRLLEYGCRIDVIEVEEDSRSVDTEEDLREVERLIHRDPAGGGTGSGGGAGPHTV